MSERVDGRREVFAEIMLDFVAVGESGGEPGGDLGHGAKMQCRSSGKTRSGCCIAVGRRYQNINEQTDFGAESFLR